MRKITKIYFSINVAISDIECLLSAKYQCFLYICNIHNLQTTNKTYDGKETVDS